MKFEKVALIGCGLMGGSFALAAREAGWAQHIVGYSASESSRQKALSMGVIDLAVDSIEQAVKDADLVLLAVPVTASYIICAVIAAPAMIKLGVPDYAAHMFIFYYAVLSEVSPPTALSPFAAAAICKGDPYKTTFQSWKYVAPAILVPFIFVLDPAGVALLLNGNMKNLATANWNDIGWIVFTASAGIVALAGGLQNWFILKTNFVERWVLIASGVALTYPSTIGDIAGFAGLASVILVQWLRQSKLKAI